MYNPFVVDKLLRLLRAKCFHCHRIRVPREKIRTFEAFFLLTKLGYALEARELRDVLDTLKRIGGGSSSAKSGGGAAGSSTTSRKASETVSTAAAEGRKGSTSTTMHDEDSH